MRSGLLWFDITRCFVCCVQDDPLTGQKELIAATAAYEEVLLIGITCGMSAPYVLGQVDWAMHQDRFVPSIIVTLLCVLFG